jgi:hypothetical protein
MLHLAIAASIIAVSVTVVTAQDRTVPTNQGQAAPSVSPGQAAIDRAVAANKYVFLFFWKEKDQKTDKTYADFASAAAKLTNLAEVVSIQITNPAEKKVVDRFSVTRAPMPLVLSVAPSGAITKAFTKTFDEKELRTAFVSPSTELCLKALQSGKLVFVCVLDQVNPGDPVTIPKGVKDFKADVKYARATEIVVVNAQDKSEAMFLKEIQVGVNASKPITVFLAPPGAPVGTFIGDSSKEAIIAKLASAQSGCCPGGKCGSGGCGPKK